MRLTATEIERRQKAEAEKERALEKDAMANELQRLIQQVKELEDNKHSTLRSPN